MAHRVTRRQILKTTGLMVPGLLLPGFSAATAVESCRLRFFHTHTGEKLDVVYRDGEGYIAEALADIDHLLRDFRTGEVHLIDPSLLDILHGVQTLTATNASFEIISGYRSPATNKMLAKKSTRVAKRSLHMQGQAIDVRLTGADTRHVQKAALKLAQGGVGFYGKSDFVHLDTGDVRSW